MPAIRLSATARKTRTGRIRDISMKDAATRRKLRAQACSSAFCPKQLGQPGLVEPDTNDFFLGDDHAARRCAARLAQVLAAGPGDFHPGRAAERREMGG